jgi:hypothetical protein
MSEFFMAIADVDEIEADVHVKGFHHSEFHRGDKVSTVVIRLPPR